MRLYCLFDTVAEESGPLFEARNDFMARRIVDSINEWPTGSKKSDFELYKLGYYDRGDRDVKPRIVAKEFAVRVPMVAIEEIDVA